MNEEAMAHWGLLRKEKEKRKRKKEKRKSNSLINELHDREPL